MASDRDEPPPQQEAARAVSSRPVTDRKAGAGHTAFLPLVVGATGVVFGDIGTSPLYTFNSIFTELHALPDKSDVQQAFSVLFWTMVWMTCFKYIGLVMRVNHHGEGGTFALMQVILEHLQKDPQEVETSEEETSEEEQELGNSPKPQAKSSWEQRVVFLLGILSCSMLIGDGVVTPPNSVLGALNSPVLTVPVSWNVVIAVFIQVALFTLQRAGSRVIGVVAGPIMILWFLTIGSLGIYQIAQNPEMAAFVARGFSPVKVYHFFVKGRFRGIRAYKSIAGIVLCVTGAEALYADMGHFGATAITTAWFVLVFPCLILQYLGQAIVLAQNPAGVYENPLYQTVPSPSFLWPLFILAALAAVIASQALISGVFTLMSQAHALGLVPRLLVLHTNPDERGQVYIPEVNWMLMSGCVAVTLAFRTSDALVAAYGIAVTGAFIFTTLLLFWVLRRVWRCNWFVVVLVLLPMLAVDIAFWTANLLKIFESGWVPLAMAGSVFFLMHTHHWGREMEHAYHLKEEEEELDLLASGRRIGLSVCTLQGLVRALRNGHCVRPKSTGVFLTPRESRVPTSLATVAHKLGALPARIILLHIEYTDEPFVAEADRVAFAAVDRTLGLWTACFRFGYAEPLTPARFDLHCKLLSLPDEEGGQLYGSGGDDSRIRSFNEEGNLDLPNDAMGEHEEERITYVVNRKLLLSRRDSSCCSQVRLKVYSLLKKNSRSATSTFGLEGQSVLEVATLLRL